MRYSFQMLKYKAFSYWYGLNYWLFDFLDGFSVLRCSRCNDWRFRRDLVSKETTYGHNAVLCNECYNDLYTGGD